MCIRDSLYTTEQKEFENYDLVEVPSNASGTIAVETDEEGNITNNRTDVYKRQLLNWEQTGENMGEKANEVKLVETGNVPGFVDNNDKDLSLIHI